MNDTDMKPNDIHLAVCSTRQFLDSCYPDWSDSRIKAEPEGAEFLRIRGEFRRLDLTGTADISDIGRTLLDAAHVVSQSIPAQDISDAEILETMGEDHGGRLIAARDGLTKALGVDTLAEALSGSDQEPRP
jgi:hypothetical protein